MIAPPVPGLPIVQAAWVVADLEPAIGGWVALGVGPFFTFVVDMPDALYRGTPVPLSFRGALAQAGDMQIELIEQLTPGPSAYRDVVPEGESGFHHVCRAFGGYDATMATLKGLGVVAVSEGAPSGARVCYADTRAQLGCMLELTDESPTITALTALVRNGALGWDGRDPIREVDFVRLMAAPVEG